MKKEIYNHLKIEKKWQKSWEKKKIYKTDTKISSSHKSKDKFYILDMFPYPSGEGLHVGHPKGYIATDIISRMKRMQGLNVLHPMGFDAFGLPAENYAIKTKTNPSVAVAKNVLRYKKQLEILGFDYDWSREINTTDPKYYKWTQWIFLQLYKKGLAYQSFEPINWCPSCKTGLANEDVEDSRCERCGTIVEKKPMRQWVLKITDYADRLLSDLDKKDSKGLPLIDWPESIKELQKNWIGKSQGAEIDFAIEDKNKIKIDKNIKVYTTRPDTIFGVTYVVLAPESDLLKSLLEDNKDQISNREEILKYIDQTKNKTEIERLSADKPKTGVEIKGLMAINPANKEAIHIWVADYVLSDYGTGAVMAVPAHDERDWSFAKKYHLDIKEVIIPERIDKRNPPVVGKEKVERRNVQAIVFDSKTDKYLCLKWKKHNWTTFPMGGVEKGESSIEAAKREVLEETGYKNIKNAKVLGGQVRAEYFAAHKDQNRVSITDAVIFELENEERVDINQKEKDDHDIVWIDKKDVFTPNFMTHAEMDVWISRINNKNDIWSYTEDGVMINSGPFNGKNSNHIKKEITDFVHGKWVSKYKIRDWVFSRQRYWGEPIPLIHCQKCGVVPLEEKDLPLKLPKVKYYEPTGTGESPLASISKWVNVKCPKCKGKAKRETNTMPQWAGSSWYYLRYMDPKNDKALVSKDLEKYWSPVDHYVGGAEHATRHLIYARFWHKFLFDIGAVTTIEPFKRLQHVGLIMGEDGRKMSKRWGNVVNPDDMVNTYGADTLRLYEMFMGPFDQAISWNTNSMIGARRFIERVWKLQYDLGSPKEKNIAKLDSILNKTIKKVTEDIDNMRYNTAVSSLMIAINEIEKAKDNNQFISKNDLETFLKLLAPFTPHICEEIWSNLKNKGSIHLASWPKYDPNKLIEDTKKIIVQINGKVRTTFEVQSVKTDKEIENMALNMDEIKKWTEGKEIKKVILVQGKLVNIVI